MSGSGILACIASVSVANFDVLAARKLGREQKKGRGGRGRGEKQEFPFLFSPSALFLFFALAPTFASLKHRNLPWNLLHRLVSFVQKCFIL